MMINIIITQWIRFKIDPLLNCLQKYIDLMMKFLCKVYFFLHWNINISPRKLKIGPFEQDNAIPKHIKGQDQMERTVAIYISHRLGQGCLVAKDLLIMCHLYFYDLYIDLLLCFTKIIVNKN